MNSIHRRTEDTEMNRSPKAVLPLIGLIPALLMAGCSSSDDDASGSDDVSPASSVPDRLLDDAAVTQLNGIWEQRGYGNLYVLDDNRTTLFSLNETSCLEITSFEGVAGIAPAELEQTRYGLEGDELSLLIPGAAFALRLNRLDTLPARCDEPLASDAQGVFDYLWNTFDEYYAFFELRGVDWAAEYARQSPRVGEAADDAALFDLLSELLSPIDDGHVLLASEDDFYSPAADSAILLELRQGFEAQSETDDFDVWIDGVLEQFRQAVLSRMDEGSSRERGPMSWATAEDGTIGYLFIEGMTGFAADASGEPREDASNLEDLLAARESMDQAMTDLADTTRMIVDVRLNGGGQDSIGLDFASRFVSERQLAFTKTARGRDVESRPVEAWLEPPSTGTYLKPVTLIVGSETASAAEIFAIPMHHQPQVTVIGERTAGDLSDILVKLLPNRWVTGLSNEVYLDSEGVSFEHVGVTPEVQMPVLRLDDIRAGADPALDHALSPP